MNKQQVEARVLDIVARVTAGNKVEDDFVECKAEWPTDHRRAARQIAALANAAQSEQVLWIVGLDEDGHALGTLDGTDPQSWWPQVQKYFADGVTPDIHVLRIPVEAGAVVCLYFDTDRSPYLVTTDGKGQVSREVPWRSGTATRSAKRHELLTLLAASAKAPTLELLDATVVCRPAGTPYAGGGGLTVNDSGPAALFIQATVFVYAHTLAMLPRHLWSLEVTTPDDHHYTTNSLIFPQPRQNTVHGTTEPVPEHPRGIWIRDAGLIVNGSDSLKLTARINIPPEDLHDVENSASLVIKLTLPVDIGARPAHVRRELGWSSVRDEQPQKVFATWNRLVPAPS